MRRLALLIASVLVAGGLAACGGSGGPMPGTVTSVSTSQQIKVNWEAFFSSKTSASDKVGLLQNGQQFKSVVEGFANSPLAKNVSAKVISVTPQGANKAKVVYTVKVSGASLGKQTGEAVKENGHWKVGDASLCKLISLGGSPPKVCKNLGG